LKPIYSDQCPRLGPRLKRSAPSNLDKLWDKHKDIGEIWTPIRGYELFIYHYENKYRFELVYNPWRLNLGRLVVLNVFVDVELIKALANKYDPNRATIKLHDGFYLCILSKDLISNVSKLECSLNFPFTVRDLATNYNHMDTSYKRWIFPLQRPRDDKNKLK
jgi:hypothetical protein